MRPENLEAIYRLSPVQEGILFHSLDEPDSGLYVRHLVVELSGTLEVERLKAAWASLVERHAALRTSFHWQEVAHPVQVVARRVTLPWEEKDWRDFAHLSDEERQRSMAELLRADLLRGFDLAQPPLIRLTLVRIAETAWELVWSFHHLILDGWSLILLLREVFSVYAELCRGGKAVVAKAVPYKDFITWQERQDGTAAERFWRRSLAGFSAPTPLPAVRPRVVSGEESRSFEERGTDLSAETTAALVRLAKQHGLTVNTLLQGAWALLLSRFSQAQSSQENDVVFGTTVSGRSAPLAGIESMVGLLINTLPLRVRVRDNGSDIPLLAWLRDLQDSASELLQHEHDPLALVQGWSEVPRGVPLFDSIVVYQNLPIDKILDQGFAASIPLRLAVRRGGEPMNYPLALIAFEGERLALRLSFERERAEPVAVERLLGHLRSLLEGMVENPEAMLADLPLLSAAERQQVVLEWNSGGLGETSGSLVSRFAAVAAERPEAVAVVGGGSDEDEEAHLTYGELAARSRGLAHWLRRSGVVPGERVGLQLERSPEMVVGILGVLAAGAAYVPLDPAYPEERLSFILDDSGARIVVRQAEISAAATMCRPSREVEPGPDDLAYLIYTSGSTGRPKGVGVTHRNVLSLLGATASGFELGADDVWTLFHSYAFDFSVWELWGALAFGARLVVVPWSVSRTPEAFQELLLREGVTVLNQTPSAFGQLTESEGLSSLRLVIFGGEALEPRLLLPWMDRYGDERPRLVNMYGITETTVHATERRIIRSDLRSDLGAGSRIGRPLAGWAVYLLGGSGEPVPLGSAGEMLIGGAGVSGGYPGRPELTAERFVPDPFAGSPGARLYRSGDLARHLPDGDLEYLGRIDHQVKVRGFRIELGEIEQALAGMPGVADAAVVLRRDLAGGDGLVAYVVAAPGADLAGLRESLKSRLPDYMVPAQVVRLDALPLTANGKLDRRWLAERAPVSSGNVSETAMRALQTPAEELLAGMFSEVLKVEGVGVEADFFALGGHSLLATQLLSRVREAFRVDLPMRAIFEHPTVAGLAREVEQAGVGGIAQQQIIPIERGADLPLSFAQQRLWFLDQLEGGSLYNVQAALTVNGDLSVAVLSRVLGEVVRRHEVLRTVFRPAGNQPRQVILPPAGVVIPVVDLTALASARREAVAAERIAAEARRPFDLTRGPLLRAGLWRLGATEHVLFLALHHIVSDGWSLGVLVREVKALYPAFAVGQPSPLPELTVQYADFAAWQRSWLTGDVLDGELRYWRDRLAGAPPVLELPSDRPRPAVQSFRGAARPLALPPELSAALTALSRREGATLFMTLVSALSVLLSRWTGQADFTLGTPVAGRRHLEIESLIGFFVNTLVLRPGLSGVPRFTELLSRVRREALAAYAHQDLPFEKLVEDLAPERSLGAAPLFQVMFAWQNAPIEMMETMELPGVHLVPRELPEEVAKFDLTLSLQESGGAIGGSLSYSTDLFDAPTIDRLAAALSVLLAVVVEDPSLPISDLSLLRPSEWHQLVVEWNDTSTLWPSGSTLPELFALQVAAHPGRLAWEYGGETLSYEELADLSDAVARFLCRQGVRGGDVVGLCFERSGAVLIAMLGILKAGAAYLPLDPDYPQERLSWMLEDSGAPLLLTQESLAHRLPLSQAGEAQIVRLDAQWEEISSAQGDPWGASPADVAYVIYTSGSTGRPKGVAVPHSAIVRLVRATDYVDFAVAGRIAQLSNLSFDAATFEIWGALLKGATLVGVPQETLLVPADLAAFLKAARIRVLVITSALFNQVVQQAPAAFAAAHCVLVGGDVVDPGAVRKVLASGAPEHLLNGYGPTENTTFSTWYRIQWVEGFETGTVPIGRPIANSRAYVLDAGLQPVLLGGVGELCLGGEGLALGYWRQPELTAERFVESPALPGERLYRTGDLARLLPDGNIEFRGRRDQQIKLRGFRIELGEIELALTAIDGVAEAAVMLRDDLPGGRGLVAYVVAHVADDGGAELSAGALRQALADRLPAYMVPAGFVQLAALPLTSNGKVDRRWLAEHGPRETEAGGATRVAPRTATEEILEGIFSSVLGIDDLNGVGAEADFFALGGHSLLATQLVSRLRAAFGVELPLRAVFEHPTVAGLAAYLEGAEAPPAPSIRRIDRGDRGVDLPLSFAQERLWFIDQLEGGSVYNVPIALRVEGELSVAVLARTLQEVVRRHEALRTVFSAVEGRVRQVILPAVGLVVPLVDLTGLSPALRNPVAVELMTAEARRPFDLARGPLLRAGLWRLGETEHLLLLAMHHIVSDGWSLGVLVREVTALYTALSEDTAGLPSPLPELPVQYADFAAWQRSWLTGDVLDGELRYWRDRLAGAPPVLELPADRPRPAVQSFRGVVRSFSLPPELSLALIAHSRREGATLFMTLVSALSVLLSRLTGQDDLTIGTAVAGRRHLEIEGLIGFFVNTLVLRPNLSEKSSAAPRFTELLARVRREALDAYAHQDLPFEKLVEALAPERSLSHTPLFQVMLAWQNAALEMTEEITLPGLRLVPLELVDEVAKFDLSLSLQEAGGVIGGFVSYSTDLFDGTTIARWIGQLETVLQGWVDDADIAVAELPLLSAAQRQQVVLEWNSGGSGATGAPAIGSLVARFAEVAAERPDAVAMVGNDAHLTYEELAARSRGLARWLRRSGVVPGERVGLRLERSLEMVVGILGVLAAGAAYVPLDPAYPEERLSFILADSGARIVVRQEEISTAVAVRDDEAGEVPSPGPDDLAYLIYTSGSTGRPKGVGVTHGNVLSLLDSTASGFGLGPHDVWTLFHSYAFDFSVWELWGALAFGGRLVVVPWSVSRTPEAFRELLLREGVTVLNQTPSAFGQLTGTDSLSSLRLVIFGGEALEPRLLQPWFDRYGDERPRLVNMYGITETTVHVTERRIILSDLRSDLVAGSRIGRPMAGWAVYLLDRSFAPVAVGAAGEIFVGGAGVSRGYPGRPELTAERFVPDPFAGSPGARLYRSGDQARHLADGDLEYLGRIDHQVKVRGFRIELGEIEAALASMAGVAEAAVVLRRDLAGGDGLVGYVVAEAGEDLSGSALREHLKARLPDYMVPAQVVLLEALPLTANGKLDRRWLAEQVPGGEPVSRTAWRSPRTAAEEILAGIFSQVLAVETVGAEADFFALGGHSLLATQLLSRLREAFGVELPMRVIFEHPTVAGLAREIEKAARPDRISWVDRITRTDRGADLPLSFAQERLWFIDQLEGGSLYNVPVALRMSGPLSVAALARTLAEVVRRHEVLRTVFAGDGGQARQVILPPAVLPLPLVDLTALPRELREGAAETELLREARRPFDLARGPLFRPLVWRLDAAEHLVLVAMHHVVSDLWSLGVLVREVAALYRAYAMGEASPLPELAVQYADFAAWQRAWLSGEVLAAELEHWRQRLAGAPPVLDLPLDRPRTAVRGHGGAVIDLTLPETLAADLLALSRRQGVTLFMTLLAAWQTLLSRISGQSDISVGTPIAGRNRAETEALIGFFVNTLVMRSNLADAASFAGLLAQVRRESLLAYAHQDLPFEKLVEELAPERNLAQTPLFQTSFALQNVVVGELALPGLRLAPYPIAESVAKFDLDLTFMESPRGLAGELGYATELLDRTTVDRLAAKLLRLLAGVVQSPELPLVELPLLSAAEQHQVLREWNDSPTAPSVPDLLLHELFERQAARTPDAVAVSGDRGNVSYGELDRRANRLARFLRGVCSGGVGPEVAVGLLVERTPALVTAILGVLKAGGVHVPFDPTYPPERLAFLAEDANVLVTLTEEALAARLPAELWENRRVVRLDADWPEIAQRLPTPLKPVAATGNAAYITYTSGSTGKPKGVVTTHSAAVDFILGPAAGLGLDATDRVLQFSALSFDLTIEEIFPVLAVGGQVVLRDPAELATTHGLMRALTEEAVTTVELPTAYWHDWVFELQRSGERLPASLRRLLTGTERVLPERVDAWRRMGVPLFHLFGVTEATINSTLHLVPPATDATDAIPIGAQLPIGRPVVGRRVYVTDGGLREMPLGATGELALGGGLARGYLGRPDLTAAKFVPDPFSGWGERLYLTGDLARWLADGNLIFLGRRDWQVKVRGFRIELGEVEAALAALPEVRETVVVARHFASSASGAGDQRLVAYVAAEPGEAVSPAGPAGLRARLAATLPSHMVPSYFVSLPALPLLANGKVDRRALPAPEEMDAGISDERGAAPRTPAEEMLAGLWSDLLGAEHVGREDDFFARGGHSLLATQLVSRVRTAFGIELPLRAVFEHPTVAGLAREIEQRSRLAGTAPPPLVRIDRVDRANDLPLSFAQQRLWFLDRLEGGSLYNVPIALRIEGDLSVALLSRALAEVVRRHEVLRTVFSEADGQARQVILPAAGFEVAHVDLTSLPAELREPVAAERIAAEARRPFDLARGPLLRAGLWRLGTTDHLLLLAMHHIVSDGWSLGVLVREVTALYAALPLPEPPVQYADFAAWQQSWLSGDVLDGELSWWREHLAGAPPLLELPTDRPRAAMSSWKGGRTGGTLALAFDPELSAALSRLAQHRSATLFMVLLAAFQCLLGRLAGTPEVCVGTPIAGRTRRETEDLIGFFVNTLVMRGDLSGDPAFAEHLARVRREALAVYAHQDLPFEKLVGELAPERSLSATPLFQVFLALQNAPLGPVELPGVTLVPVELESGLARFDLEVSLEETEEGLTGAVQYDAGLFDRTTIVRLAGQLEMVLRSVVASPERRLSDLPLLTVAERQQLVEEWSHAETVPRLAGTLHGLFAAQAARTPAATAVIAGTERLSYGELAGRVRRLAGQLSQLDMGTGRGPERIVGVRLGRTANLVVALLAVLESGAAYLPLDPAYPAERLRFLLADTGAALVVSERSLAWPEGFTAEIPELYIDEATLETASAPVSSAVAEDNLAYVIYTSGSTGVPKGVAIPHGSALRLVEWALARYSAAELARVLFSTSTSFDLSIFELFVPLSSGGAVIVADNALALPGLPAASEVTLVNTVPSALAGLLDLGPLPAAVRTVNLAGEPLRCALAERVHGAGVARLWNLYGPSEDTTYSTGTEVAAGTGREPDIGRPLAGSTAFVLDGSLEVLPVGVPGELCLGGEALARGYLNRPELTAERFVPDPFGGLGGSRLYRTGDRARWRSDGALELLGRMDHQVKVRGFRIELGEIEAVLAGHPAVREAAVTAPAGASGDDRRLVAYVSATEGGGPLDTAALGVYLGSRLPSFMVPSVWVELAALPLTRTGKVDRQALPAPGETATGQAYEAPRTATEAVLAEIWGDLLHRERVGVHDNFFALGGHSLLATQMVSRLRDRLGVELPVRALFEQPTVAGLAVLLADHDEVASGPIVALPRDAEGGGTFPASFAQRRLWLFDQLEPGSAVYNMPLALSFEGELAEEQLAAVFGELARRHETLHTTFVAGTDGPLQVVHPIHQATARPFAFQTIDLSALGEEERRRELTRRVAAESLRPFDLASGPLLRATLVRLAARENALLLTLHHVISDGWSMGALVREVTALYAAAVAQRPLGEVLPPLPVQYADFSVWQSRRLIGETLAREIEHWRQKLAGVPPFLELPADRPRPPVQTFGGRSLPLWLEPGLAGRLSALALATGTTLFMVLLAGFETLLGIYSGAQDLAVGTPIAGRNRAELEGLIGFFVNSLVLRADLSGDPSFVDLLGRVREDTLSAYAHQDLPFEKLVEEVKPERSRAHSPIFQVMFALQNAPMGGGSELPGLTMRPMPPAPGSETPAKYDLTLLLSEGDGGIGGSLEYNVDLFDAPTMVRLLDHWRALLAGVVAGSGARLSALPLLGAAERQQLLREWSDAAPVAGGASGTAPVHELFAAEAARRPDAVALVSCHQVLTYGELARRSSRMARRLADLGVGPGVLVGLCAERSPELVLGALAILAAGGAYLPLDPSHPMERLAYTLADAGAPILLAEERLHERLPAGAARVVGLHALAGEEVAGEVPSPLPRVDPGDLAYVIYTSGSTGRPKGVEVSHANVARLFAVIRQNVPFGPGDVWTLFHSIAFDFSVWELWGALAFGGRLVIVPGETARSPETFYELLRRERVTVLSQTPSAFRQLLWAEESALARTDADDAMVSDLRLVVFGGEALDPASLAPWLERHGEERPLLVNLYGITETTVHTTWRRLRQSDLAQPGSAIGRPLSDLSLHLLDGGGRPVPIGVPGEIHVGGAGVARGYLARPALTAERFVPDPFAGAAQGKVGGHRLYRSGDLARWRRDGDLEYLGRIDRQVKVRGFRIELGEIEAALAEHPGVREAVVVAREDRPGDVRLVGYVSSAAKPDPSPQALAAFLAERLPGYMVPAAWVLLDRLPLTANGKVDRRALPAPAEREEGGTYVAPRSPVEQVLAGIWEEVLERQRVGVEDDFFALGGHSLVAAQVTSRVLKAFSVELPLRVLFERPTVAALAAEVERLRGSGASTAASAAPPLVRAPRGTEAPLSFRQEWRWLFDQLSPGDVGHNVPLALTLRGAVSAPALAAALAAEVERHESLRTRIVSVGGKPVQRIDPHWRPPLPFVDLGGLPPAAAEREAARLAEVEWVFHLDVARGPLLRSLLLRLKEEVFVLLLTLHHIISDGWSMRVLARELPALYQAAQAGLPSPLPELPLQFRDFAIWQRGWLQGEVLESLLGAAARRLAGMQRLDLPLDRPLSERRYSSSGVLPFELDAALIARLSALSRRQGASLFMTVLAAFTGLLRRHTGRGDFPVATITAGRTRAELEPLIGYFTNTLLIRAAAGGDPTFGELLARTRGETLAAYDHQDLPFSHLVEALRAERGEPPVFEVLFLLQPPSSEAAPVDAEVVEFPVEGTHSQDFPLVLDLLEAGGGLIGTFSYNLALFDPTTPLRWRGHLEALLAGAAADPARPLTELPLLSEGERHQVTFEWGEAVHVDGGPAPIGIWGELAGAPAGRRARRLADGTLEVSAPAPAFAAPAPIAPRGPSEPARSLDSLSTAKRKLLARRIRGER